jgi:hypothetical protein
MEKQTELQKYPVLEKPASVRNSARLQNYRQSVEQFSGWPSPSQNLNIATQAVDRHLTTGLRDEVALKFVKKNWSFEEGGSGANVQTFTYLQLSQKPIRWRAP